MLVSAWLAGDPGGLAAGRRDRSDPDLLHRAHGDHPASPQGRTGRFRGPGGRRGVRLPQRFQPGADRGDRLAGDRAPQHRDLVALPVLRVRDAGRVLADRLCAAPATLAAGGGAGVVCRRRGAGPLHHRLDHPVRPHRRREPRPSDGRAGRGHHAPGAASPPERRRRAWTPSTSARSTRSSTAASGWGSWPIWPTPRWPTSTS